MLQHVGNDERRRCENNVRMINSYLMKSKKKESSRGVTTGKKEGGSTKAKFNFTPYTGPVEKFPSFISVVKDGLAISYGFLQEHPELVKIQFVNLALDSDSEAIGLTFVERKGPHTFTLSKEGKRRMVRCVNFFNSTGLSVKEWKGQYIPVVSDTDGGRMYVIELKRRR